MSRLVGMAIQIERRLRLMGRRLAEELEYARRLLDTMGDELAADMGVIMRHSVALVFCRSARSRAATAGWL